MEVVETCQSIVRPNLYLKASRDEVNAGVPGKFLHAVMGQDFSDVSSVVSTIIYAFHLNEIQNIDQFCTIPVINMTRADVSSHAEIKWLLDSCQIDQSSLIFLDEIVLSYYDLFGSLKIVLLNGDRLPAKQAVFKEAVVEIFGSKKDSVYPLVQTVTTKQDCSCSALIAENFALYSSGTLAGKGFSQSLREFLVSTESVELMKNLIHFLNSNASQLALKLLHQPGLKDKMRAFEVDKDASRRTIERLLDEFVGSSRR